MNFFEQELRKLFAEQFPNATYVGRNCYIPLDNQIRACISFKTNGYADHYDTIHAKVLDRESGTIDSVTIRLKELLGVKSSSSPYLKGGVAPHIWVNGNDASWYGFTPSSADYSKMREAVTDYVAIFQEPVMEQAPQEHQQSM